MNGIWNDIIEPVMKEFNPNNVLEIGSNSTDIYELIDYLLNNNGHLYSINSSPNYNFELLENNLSNIYKHFNNFDLNEILKLNIDLIIINKTYDSSEIINYLNILDKCERFPIILFYDTYLENNSDTSYKKKFLSIKENDEGFKEKKQKTFSLNEVFQNENNILLDFEKFVENSRNNPKKLVFLKIDSFRRVGILFSEEKTEKFNNISFSPQEQILYKKINNLKEKLKKKNDQISEKESMINSYSKSFSWRITKPLRFISRIMKKILFNYYIFIILKSNIHFKITFQNIKAYNLLKESDFLFDQEFYISQYPSVKKFKFSPLIHYMYYGYNEGKFPNKNFSENYQYNKINDMNPLVYAVLFDKNIKNEVEYRRLKAGKNISFFKRIYREILFKRNLKISIKVPAQDEKSAFFWGDYHFALSLKKEFEKKNYKTDIVFRENWNKKDNSDVVLVLRGLFEYKTNPNQINLMWNISHPDLITAKEYNTYDHVFIASEVFTKKLKKILKIPVTSLLQCTDNNIFYPNFSKKYKHELLFVGNSRGIFRQIIKDLVPTKRELGLYGRDWDTFLPKSVLSGDYIPNNELNKAYSSCKILLNDHWEDMGKNGFISNRIFDGLACKAFIISDKIQGIGILKDSIVVYKNPENLKELIEYYINNEEERLEKARLGQKIVLNNHTFEKRVEKILEVIADLNESK